MRAITPYRNIRIEDEKQRQAVLEDLPILSCSFSSVDFESLIESLSGYPECKEYIDRAYPGLIGKRLDCFPQILDIMCKSGTFIEEAKSSFEDMRSCILSRPELDNVDKFFYFLDTLSEREGFEGKADEYSMWRKLYDKVPATYIDNDAVPDIIALAFSQREEDRELLRKVLRTTGKNTVFSRILMGEKNVRDEKMIIIDSLTNGDIDSLQFIGSGVSGIVFKSGKKVIKLSNTIGSFEIPYHPRLLMPYFRKGYDDYTALEVYNFGKVKSAQITDEKLLEIYKELEAAGIIWTDAKKENLVELLEDNTLPEYNLGKNFNLYSFLEDDRYPTDNHTVLKKGDIVICDLNHLYTKDNPLAELRIGMPDKVIEDYLDKKDRMKRRTEERNSEDGR